MEKNSLLCNGPIARTHGNNMKKPRDTYFSDFELILPEFRCK